MRILLSVAWREFAAYFSTALAVVFLVVFVGAAGALTFDIGGFLNAGQADLSIFFSFHPWLFLILMPAIGMRLWAEERRSGTIEFLMTLPVATWQAVLGKFLAAWAFASLALALTFPIWITVNYLGDPDNGVILASYAGSFLMGGAFLALACCISALTTNQVTAFVLGVTAGFIMMMNSLEPIVAVLHGWAPDYIVDLISSLSFAKHFDAITRGVLDLRDVIFFLSFIVLTLFINIQILDRKRARGPMSSTPGRRWSAAGISSAAIALAVVLFLGLNFLSTWTLGAARLDLTERKLFTLSDTTRQVLASIVEPITIRLYETRQLVESVPALQVHAKQVSELLTNLEQIAGGKIRLETIDVLPFSTQEDEALGFGLQGFPLSDSGERGYFGIVGTNSVDSIERVEFLDPAREAFLQYDLTRLVYRLAQPDETKVRVIDGLGMFGSMTEGRQPWTLLNLIGTNFALEGIALDATTIPDDTDVLIVAHPVRLSAELQYAIDQYTLKGGAALVFLDPLAEHSPPSGNNPAVPEEPSSAMPELLRAWGVEMDPTRIVGDHDMAIQTVGVAGGQRVVAPYLPWLRIEGPAFNPDDVITAQLEIMRMSSAGAIRTLDQKTTTVTPLLQSTENSMLMDQSVVMQRVDPNVLLNAFKASGQRQALAVRIGGPAKSAFPNGPPSPQPGAAAPPGLAEGSVNVVVVADTDLLSDDHVVGQDGQLNSSNADFVLNTIEALAGGDALIGIRGGGLSYRPFGTIDAIQARAEQTYRATEQRLSQELDDDQAKLTKLQQSSNSPEGDPLAASRDQQAAITQFNSRILELRQQLRDVRAALRAEIEAVENWLRFLNIFLVPIVLIVLTGLLELWRRVRLARHMRRPVTG